MKDDTKKKPPSKKTARKPVKKKTAARKKRKPKIKNALTDKREVLCQAYIECGGNQSKAYRMAYNAENMKPETVWNEAYKLFGLPEVAARVIQLQAKHAERHDITVDKITKHLNKAIKFAENDENSSDLKGAAMAQAKLHGLIVDKTEDLTKRKKPRVWQMLVVDPADT